MIPIEAPGERARVAALADYYRSELRRTEGEIQPPNETALAALEGCREDIDALIGLLTDSPPPEWETRVLAGFDAPTPNLSAHVGLQRLLAAEALNRARLGLIPEAERALNASWTLNSSLRERPDPISQLIAIAIARIQVGLLRRIPVDPVTWGIRLGEHDYRASLLNAIEVESITSLRALPKGRGWFDRATRADFLDLRRSFLVRLRDSPVSDAPPVVPPPERRSAGGIIESITEPNLVEALSRVDRLIVDTELTERVLLLCQLKVQLGHWPAESSELRASRLQGAQWIYRVGGDGRMEIRLNREPGWESRGLMLPVRCELEEKAR